MIKIELVGNWKEAWKFYSVWVYVLLGMLPDIFDLAVKMEVFSGEGAPEALNWTIKFVAFIGVVVRIVKQGVVAAKAAEEAGQAEAKPE
jgi:hypothetical protein